MTSRAQGAAPTCAAPRHRTRAESGILSLEAVWVLPVLALLVVGLLETAGLVRDVLLLQEAARMGARTAATTTGVDPVVAAAREAAPELELHVEVTPSTRGDGDLAVVRTRTSRTIGPVRHELSARAVVRVEPSVTRPGPGTNGIHGPVPP